MKNTEEWKQYEWLISKIFHNRYYSIEVKVLPNTKISGKYSERSRQIDILVIDGDKKIILECKHYSEPLDVKNIESFIGMYNDIKASEGIIISSSVFSKSAKKRISEYKGSVKLEHIEWEEAYSSFKDIQSGHINDLCDNCRKKTGTQVEVPGLLLWNYGYAIEKLGIVYLFHYAKCLKCNKFTIACDSCGHNFIAYEEEPCCKESIKFEYELLCGRLDKVDTPLYS
ncbi:restriction endonuclease [Malaciobacter sp. WC5094]